jgi:hypothetical protein
MRLYPISSFLFWQVAPEACDDVEAYEFIHNVRAWGNRAQLAGPRYGKSALTFVLDGQQRLTSFLVGLQGSYYDRKTKSGKGSKTYVPKKLFLDLLHDGRVPDVADGETYYHFDFFDYTPSLLNKDSYWFEVGRILKVGPEPDAVNQLVERQAKAIRDVRALPSQLAEIAAHNLRRLHDAIFIDDVISYHIETNPDHERILEIFVRANSGGTQLSKSDLLLSTLTLHWGTENAREEINGFLESLNNDLTRKNGLTRDFIMKACLVLLNLPVAYRVSSFTKETCARIKERWSDIQSAIRRAVDAANAFCIDENTLTSANALIPVAYYLYQHAEISLRGESAVEVKNASKVRIWLLSALLNRVLSGSSDTMLTKMREVLQLHDSPRADFPIAPLDDAERAAGRVGASSDDAIENVLDTTYNDNTCFLALAVLYDERNWGTIKFSIDHLFSRDEFNRTNMRDDLKARCDDYGNLALVIGDENSGKSNRPLHEWLRTRTTEYLKRHLIPRDPTLWNIDRFEDFLIERRKLLRARLLQVFTSRS